MPAITPQPFYVEKGRPMVDLNTLTTPSSDIHFDEAWNINDRGENFGSGLMPDGSDRAVLLVPLSGAGKVPENPLRKAPALIRTCPNGC